MTFISWIKRNIAIDKRAKREGKGETRFRIFFLSLALPLFYEREREKGGYNIPYSSRFNINEIFDGSIALQTNSRYKPVRERARRFKDG